MNTIADQLFNAETDYNKLMDKCHIESIREDQDWDLEETTFIFDDHSAIKFTCFDCELMYNVD